MRKVLMGICAVIFALVLIGTNGLAMENEMTVTSTIDLEHIYNFSDETQLINNTLGAVADFQDDSGVHNSMLSVSYINNAISYNLTFATYNETDGLYVTNTTTVSASQVYRFEPQNDTAILNDTFYWTYVDTYSPHLWSNPSPEPDVTLAHVNIGYYADSEDINSHTVFENIGISWMNYSIVTYQGFVVWSIPGAIIYYTDLDGEPVDHILQGETDGCQCNCIFDDKLYFAGDQTLYQMSDSILDPAWDSFEIGKSNKQVTALDTYMDAEGTAHLIICYSNDSVIYEFLEEEVVPYIEMPEDIDISTIENTRNYDGKFFVSGYTQDDKGFIASISDDTTFDHTEIATDDADADAMCNLTSEEQLYVFNDYTGGDYDCYQYIAPEENGDEEENVEVELTEAGHWTTGEATTELYAYVNDIIVIEAIAQSDAGIDSMTLSYKGVGDTTYTDVDMDLSSGTEEDGTWTAEIPAQDTAGLVYLKITAISGTDSATTTVYTLDIIGEQQQVTQQPSLIDTLTASFCNIWGLLIAIIALIVIYYIVRKR